MRPTAANHPVPCLPFLLLGIGVATLAGSLGCGAERGSGEYEIIVDHLGRIGERDGDGMLIGRAEVNWLAPNQIALFDWGDPGRVKLFLSSGEFLGAFGRPGQGPAEFQRPAHIYRVGTGDTLLVLDYAQGRLTQWSADGGIHYETRLYPTALVALFLNDGKVVLNAPELLSESLPVPLRLVGREGEAIRAFGTPYRPDLHSDARPAQRLLAQGPDGTIWEAPLFEYRMAQWDTLGNLLRDLRGEHIAMPLPGRQVVTPRSPGDSPPTPFLAGIAWDEADEVLWVMLAVAHPDWRARLASRRDPRRGTLEEVYTGEKGIRRTQLDAWDPVRGRLLASRVLDERWMLPLGPPGLGHSYVVTPEGYLSLDLWRARLVEKGR